MRLRRIRVAVTGLAIVAAMLGLAVQARWDAQCRRADPATSWNPDRWECLR